MYRMNKGIWVGMSIGIFGAVMLGINFAEAQEAVEVTLGSFACENGETLKFVGNSWKCKKMQSFEFAALQLEPQTVAPEACTVDNIGAVYLHDGPQFDGVCICVEYGDSPQYVDLTGTDSC